MGGGSVAGRPFVSDWSRMLIFRSENATTESLVEPAFSETHVSVDLEAVSNLQACVITRHSDRAMARKEGSRLRVCEVIGGGGGRNTCRGHIQ